MVCRWKSLRLVRLFPKPWGCGNEFGFCLAQFFALIDADGAREGHEHGAGEARDGVFGYRMFAPAGHVAWHIVVGEGPIGVAVWRAVLEAFDAVAEVFGVEVWAEHREAVGHVQAVDALGVFAHDFDGTVAHFANFAHHHDVVVLVG